MLKAIETRYKGYRFRSRLEARWAVFFDALGIRWEYEVEGFETEAGRYLPDFWLPDFWAKGAGLWVEIKPIDGFDRGTAAHKMTALIDAQYRDGKQISTGYIFCGQPIDEEGLYFFFNTKQLCVKQGSFEGGEPWMVNIDSFIVHRAYSAARAARFEHGESPNA